MNTRVPLNNGEFLGASAAVGFSRRTPLHEGRDIPVENSVGIFN
jgi:hypothetical protein